MSLERTVSDMVTVILILSVANVFLGLVAVWQRHQTILSMSSRTNLDIDNFKPLPRFLPGTRGIPAPPMSPAPPPRPAASQDPSRG